MNFTLQRIQQRMLEIGVEELAKVMNVDLVNVGVVPDSKSEKCIITIEVQEKKQVENEAVEAPTQKA